MKKYFSILTFFFVIHVCHAQHDVTFTRYSQEEGMPAVTIRQIFEDGQGFLWIMTEQGVHRYDGYSFKTFRHDPADPFSIAANKPYAFLCDSSRNPILLFNNAISVYDAGTQHFRNYVSGQLTRPNNMPLEISATRNDYARNCCWFVSVGSLIQFYPSGGQVFYYPTGTQEKYSSIIFISDNSILLAGATCSRALEFNVVSKTFRDYQDNELIRSIESNHTLMDVSGGSIFLDNMPGSPRMVFAGERFYFFDKNNPEHPSTYKPRLTNSEYDYKRMFVLGNEIWISTDHGKVISINASTGKETVYDVNVNNIRNVNDKPVYSICADDEGEIWATSDGLGLIRINPVTGKIIQYSEIQGNPNSVWSSSCSSIFKHRSGVLWVSFLSNGLIKVEKQKKIIPTYLPLNPAAIQNLSGKRLSADVRAVLPLDSTHLLVGALSNLCVIDTKTGTADFARNKKGKEIVKELADPGLYTSFAKDRHGNIIVGTWRRKYFIYNPDNDFFREYSDQTGFSLAPLGNQTRALLLDSQNRLWITTEAAVAVIDEDLFLNATPDNINFKTYPIGPGKTGGITGLPAFCLFEDSRKNIWIGTAQGLNRISPEGTVEQFVNNIEDLKTLSENDVRSIREDDEGHIWIGTNGGGINRYDPATREFTAFTMRNGLPDESIYTFLFSAEKNIWLSSNRGLAEFNPKTGTVKKFTPYDGLQNYEYNTNAAGIMPDGRLVFGGTSGVNVFDPSSLHSNSSVPEIALNAFKIFNKEIALPQEGITVKHDENNLAFEFAALSFYRSAENQYAYKMENFDPDWIYCGNAHTASYNNLPPGSYVFTVKGSNSGGAWNTKGVSFPITILPPWWQTWWARVIAVIFLSFCIYFFIQLRTKSLRDQRRDLEEKVEERTAELKSSQQQLIQQEKLASLGQITAGIAHELKNPLNFVTNFADLSVGLIDEMKHVQSEEDRNEILGDLEVNLSKINEHGKRADGIVQSMLQHTRSGSAATELRPTNINSLADECFDLAFESVKARSQNFRCQVDKQLDPSLPKISVMPQEISRALISILNNAFYAAREKSVALRTSDQEFVPKVSLVTRLLPGTVSISISDNGSGIPDSVREKIFQPFFTTKPTGQGTGLGLSICYDIIKAHNGEIKVDTSPSSGTTFTILLPGQ